jgi:YVTN family beta-propeller protein
MRSNVGKRRFPYWRGAFAALCAALVLAIGLSARPAQAAPFAYVTSYYSNTVSVIDTATNTVVATIPVGNPLGVAITPDGTKVYVTNNNSGTVSVIATATDTVVGSPIPVGNGPFGVAITPDGTKVYVTNNNSGTVSVIVTATNTVVATIPVGNGPFGVAVAPDGTKVYVANSGSNTVSVIATATNTVVAAIPVGIGPFGAAVTPDGTKVYVASYNYNTVSVIATATNTVVATIPVVPTIPVGAFPVGVAVTPDGTNVYVAILASATVSVIATATNSVVATIPVENPEGVALTPDGTKVYVSDYKTVSVIATATNTVVAAIPVVAATPLGLLPQLVAITPGIPFSAFKAALAIEFGKKPNADSFVLLSEFTLGQSSDGINPPAEPVTLKVGTFTTTIPAGSFTGSGNGPFYFVGTVNGVNLQIGIVPTGAKRYGLGAAAQKANLTGTANPVPVTLTIGDDAGTTSVNAEVGH